MMQLDQMGDSQPWSFKSFVGMEEVLLGHGGLFGLNDGGQSLTNPICMGNGDTPGGWKQGGFICVAFK